MRKPLEQPFEFLLRKMGDKAGASFSEDIVRNWYIARAFVLYKFQNICIKPDDGKHLHVVIVGDNSLMLSIVRQVALMAHFPNHKEESGCNRTIITIVSDKGEQLLNTLKQEEYLCNLVDYCKYTINNQIVRNNSYLDVEIEITTVKPELNENDTYEILINDKEVDSFCDSKLDNEIYFIDTSKAQYAARMYSLGTEIDNLPYQDIHSVERYSMALDVFLYSKMEKELEYIVDKDEWGAEDNQMKVLLGLSNIFCADCFITKYNSIKPYWENGEMTEKQAWEKHYLALSKSEHSRWVVEKLILGFKPLSNRQRLEDECAVKDKDGRSKYRKGIKRKWESPSHIDLCSFAELRRVDPDNMKYDSFLMLGIPHILRKVGEIPNKLKR